MGRSTTSVAARTRILVNVRDLHHRRLLTAEFRLLRHLRGSVHASGPRAIVSSLKLAVGRRIVPVLGGERPTRLVSRRIG